MADPLTLSGQVTRKEVMPVIPGMPVPGQPAPSTTPTQAVISFLVNGVVNTITVAIADEVNYPLGSTITFTQQA